MIKTLVIYKSADHKLQRGYLVPSVTRGQLKVNLSGMYFVEDDDRQAMKHLITGLDHSGIDDLNLIIHAAQPSGHYLTESFSLLSFCRRENLD
jgi:hypothetical protein